MTAREVLDGIRGRLAAATPGPWTTEPIERGRYAHIESRVYRMRGSHILLSPSDGEAGQAKTTDAAFIAAAPTDVTRLVAAVDTVLGLADRARFVARADGKNDGCVSTEQLHAAIEAALKEGE